MTIRSIRVQLCVLKFLAKFKKRMLEPIGKILNITKGRGFLKNDI